MLTTRFGSIVVSAAIFVLVAGSALAQKSPDFESTITGSADIALEGSTVRYVVGVANVGDGYSPNVIFLEVDLPSGVPCDISAYLNNDPDAVAAFDAFRGTIQYNDALFDPDPTITLGPNFNCDGFMLESRELILPPATEGYSLFDAIMPTHPFYEGAVHVSSATLNADLNFGQGTCDMGTDCSQHPCLGPRISTIEPITGTLELVDDGSADPTLGCNALQNFSAGNIALIDRGSCAFEVKIANALFAGASGVLVADNDDFSDSTVDPSDVMDMACTSYCSEELVTIPAAFVSYADAQILHADLDADNPVTTTIGKKESGKELTTESFIWEVSNTPLETYDGNNRSFVTTMVGESGGTAPTPDFRYDKHGLTVTFTDVSTGGPDSWTWNFGDGSGTVTERDPVHIYSAPGDYEVTLTATNSIGSNNFTKTLRVGAPSNMAPLFTDGFESGTPCWWNDSIPALSCASDFPEITITLPGDVTMELLRIPAGTFMMGSPEDEPGRLLNEDLHQVTLTHDYYIGKYEVTQAQWGAVMGSNVGDNTPVDWVDWDDICGGPTSSNCTSSSFIGKLNAYLTQTGQPGAGEFRLPTEAEWERAARGRTQTTFSFGDYGSCAIDDCSFCDIFDRYMVYCENDNADVVEVGSRAPNGYGLYDMHGNVFEWVGDWDTVHLGLHAVTDPEGPQAGSTRSLRGGSHFNLPSGCRSASRTGWPGWVQPAYGFRLARSE